MQLANTNMRKIFVFFLLLGLIKPVISQNPKDYSNAIFLQKLNKDTSYLKLKKRIISKFALANPGQWGEFVNGVVEKPYIKNKYIAFTFDGCGGKNGNDYDKELMDYLQYEKVPATLFVSGKWIDANFTTFLNLSKDTLFEIENHGLNHKPCSIDGKSEYGITGTSGIEEAFDEIEANARKIEAITKHKPLFYRSATAFIDEVCVRMAGELGITVVSFQVLAGDAVAYAPYSVIEENVLKEIKPGAIVLMHFNHPEWNTFEAMQEIIPKLRQMGYFFKRLNDFEITSYKVIERQKEIKKIP